jgi:hypothetical protein
MILIKEVWVVEGRQRGERLIFLLGDEKFSVQQLMNRHTCQFITFLFVILFMYIVGK